MQQHHSCRKRREHHRRTDQFCNRCFQQLAAEPAQRHQNHRDRKKKRAEPAKLEEEIGDVRADRANPVVRRPRRRSARSHVERRIVRRVGKQAEREQHRQAEPDEADHLVDALILGRCKDAHLLLLWPCRSCRVRSSRQTQLLFGGSPRIHAGEERFSASEKLPFESCALALGI